MSTIIRTNNNNNNNEESAYSFFSCILLPIYLRPQCLVEIGCDTINRYNCCHSPNSLNGRNSSSTTNIKNNNSIHHGLNVQLELNARNNYINIKTLWWETTNNNNNKWLINNVQYRMVVSYLYKAKTVWWINNNNN